MKININKVLILLVFLSALVSTGCSQSKKINNPPRLKNTQVQNFPDKGNEEHVLTHADQKSNLNTTSIATKPKHSNDSSLIRAGAGTNMSNSSSDSTTQVVKATTLSDLSTNAQNAHRAYCETQKSLDKSEYQLKAINKDPITSIRVVEFEIRTADAATNRAQGCAQSNIKDKDKEHIKKCVQDAKANTQRIKEIYQEMLKLKGAA